MTRKNRGKALFQDSIKSTAGVGNTVTDLMS